MAVGTAAGNVGEFRHWALEDVSAVFERVDTDDRVFSEGRHEHVSAVSALVRTFEDELDRRSAGTVAGGTMAVPAHSAARYRKAVTFRIRAVYALGALLRGNPEAQRLFVREGGPDLLVRDALGTLSSVRGDRPLVKLDYKLASKVLSLGEDVVADASLHAGDYESGGGTREEDGAGSIAGSFATEAWCDLALRMLSPPDGTIGLVAERAVKERALRSARALGPGCRASSGDGSWGVDEVTKVRSEFNREGSGDGLDPAYRRELLELADGVLEVLRQKIEGET